MEVVEEKEGLGREDSKMRADMRAEDVRRRKRWLVIGWSGRLVGGGVCVDIEGGMEV